MTSVRFCVGIAAVMVIVGFPAGWWLGTYHYGVGERAASKEAPDILRLNGQDYHRIKCVVVSWPDPQVFMGFNSDFASSGNPVPLFTRPGQEYYSGNSGAVGGVDVLWRGQVCDYGRMGDMG